MTWTPQVTMPEASRCVPDELLLILEARHTNEIAKLRMQLLRYRAALEENGIEPPDAEGADLLQMWQDCREVIKAAHNCVANLGTSKELLAESWRA